MTDIEQQIAQASETRKSTAILADPEHIKEPLQILPFVISFFRAYTTVNRQKYLSTYGEPKYNFAKMLIGFSDPPNFGAIMSNGDYYIYWSQSQSRIDMWFNTLNASMQNTPEEKSIWKTMVDFFKTEKETKDVSTEATISFVITQIFQSLDEKYREFQHALINAESAAIQSFQDGTVLINTLKNEKVLKDREWIDRMDEFVRNQKMNTTNPTTPTLSADLGKIAYNFVKNVFQSAPLFVGSHAPLPIGVELNAINATPRTITIGARQTVKTTTKKANQPLSTPSATASSRTVSTPEQDVAAANRMNKETTEATNNSIIEHYRQVTTDFGNYMLEVFRSFNFPPVFALDQGPEFTVEWDGYVKLAYQSFNQLAAQRAKYLYKIGEASDDTPPFITSDEKNKDKSKTSLEDIYADENAAALFAELVGYKKAVPQHTTAPAPNVQRTNATYHYAINNMSLRFVSLYDYLVEKTKGKKRRLNNGLSFLN